MPAGDRLGWFHWNPGDHQRDEAVRAMPLVALGAYWNILNTLYTRNDATATADQAYTWSGCTAVEWQEHREAIARAFEIGRDGTWTQQRADLEIRAAHTRVVKATERAKLAAKARWDNKPAHSKRNGSAMPDTLAHRHPRANLGTEERVEVDAVLDTESGETPSPPRLSDAELEADVLGALLEVQSRFDTALADGLTADAFRCVGHPLVFAARAAVQPDERGNVLPAVVADLERTGDLDVIGGEQAAAALYGRDLSRRPEAVIRKAWLYLLDLQRAREARDALIGNGAGPGTS